MKEEIKNLKILEKLVRPEKAKMLKRVQHDKSAFTLAEVLITLGIIGVVAAMTIPSLVQHYKKQVVETKLQKVYSVMNQAIAQSELVNGEKETWQGGLTPMEFYEQYYKGFVKVAKVEQVGSDALMYFADGSLLRISTNGRDYVFYINSKSFIGDKTTDNNNKSMGRDVFSFRFAPYYNEPNNKIFEPDKINWDGTESDLFNNSSYGCANSKSKHYCTAIIQLNGWKIPDDYPIKF